MNPLRSLLTTAVAVSLALPACASETTAPEPEAVGQSHEALITCKVTNTCCASTAAGFLPWDLTDPFQVQLSAWGCTRPRLYQPYQTTNAWWYYAQCTDAASRIETFLAGHPVYQAAPYLAVTSTTLDKVCVMAPPAGSVDVLWDPTCPTCKLVK